MDIRRGDEIVRRGHTQMATCAASIAIREAATSGVPEEHHKLIGMRAGWAVLEGLGYEVPANIQTEMELGPALNT